MTSAIQTEALDRARNGQSLSNYSTIIDGFSAMGIADIRPRENVLTYQAWKALGRQVRRGEHGVKVTTWIPVEKKGEVDGVETVTRFRRPKTATVFHITQTDEGTKQ